MNIYEILGLFAAVVSILGFMWTVKKDLGNKFDSLHTDMQAQSARIDKLYSMFVDLVTKMK